MKAPVAAAAAALMGLALLSPPAGALPPVSGAAVPAGAPTGVRAVALPPSAAQAVLPMASAAPKPERILLTPTTDPATSQTISWTVPRKVRGQGLQYRSEGIRMQSVPAARRPATSKKASGSTAPRYSATLIGLTPATRYEYRIAVGTRRTVWRTFTTADPARAEVTIVGLGDTQVDNRGVPRRTVRRALADAPDAQLVLHAGDVVDRPHKGAQWKDLFAAMGASARTRNWLVSIGNHEQCVLLTRCESNAAEAFRSYFDWPTNGFEGQGETWFHLDYQGVRIVVLDSFGGRMEEQAQFLDQALAANPYRWSIVLMHAPPFATLPGRTNDEVRRLWLPILEARNVDLVLSGHDHSYSRGYRSYNGPVYVQSVSGPKYYDVTDADWVANRATRLVWAAGTSTYQVIRVSGDTLTYRAVVSHRGPTSTSPFGPGGVLDQFVIDKSKRAKVVR